MSGSVFGFFCRGTKETRLRRAEISLKIIIERNIIMKIVVCNTYDELSQYIADRVASLVNENPECILGLATGSTPVGAYEKLGEMCKAGKVDFSKVRSFNLDEYLGLTPDNDQSYRYFMNKNLFEKINIDINNTRVPSGISEDPDKMCKEYDEAIDAAGGIDLQLLGIGENGHIAFNEPASQLYSGTHVTDLTESTIKANSRFFEKIEDVPTQAVTMGIGSIMKAKSIIIAANGANKKAAVDVLRSGMIDTNCPASVLNAHRDVTLVVCGC